MPYLVCPCVANSEGVCEVIIVSFINPDFEKQKKQKFVVGRSRTTVNAIVRVSIYHRLYSDGTRDLARFARGF